MSHWIWLPGEIKTESFYFDSIYAAYLSFETDGDVKIGAMWYEKPDQTNENDTYSLTFSGDKEISLSPRLLGLGFAEASMPTPYGNIYCNLRQGHAPVITVPPEIKYTVLREDTDI